MKYHNKRSKKNRRNTPKRFMVRLGSPYFTYKSLVRHEKHINRWVATVDGPQSNRATEQHFKKLHLPGEDKNMWFLHDIYIKLYILLNNIYNLKQLPLFHCPAPPFCKCCSVALLHYGRNKALLCVHFHASTNTHISLIINILQACRNQHFFSIFFGVLFGGNKKIL